MSAFESIRQSLLEAIEIEKGNIPIIQKDGLPAPTFTVFDKDENLIDELISLRKKQNITQEQIAQLVNTTQQTISRIERKENSPSLKLFYSMADALGYEIKIEKIEK